MAMLDLYRINTSTFLFCWIYGWLAALLEYWIINIRLIVDSYCFSWACLPSMFATILFALCTVSLTCRPRSAAPGDRHAWLVTVYSLHMFHRHCSI